MPLFDYRIGVPAPGRWNESLNSDAAVFGGSGMGNCGGADTQDVESHGLPASLLLIVPPLATIILTHAG